jgi:hypothetical protein
MLREMFRSQDLHLARFDIGFVDDAADAPIVVDVRMAVDDRDDGPLAKTGGNEVIGSLGGLNRDQGIENNPTSVPCNRSPPSRSNCDRNREVMQVCSGAGESVGDV